MLIVAEALPGPVSTFFATAAASRSSMQDIIVKGRALAKDAGTITSERVRVILPLPVSLVIVDTLVADRLNERIGSLALSADPGFLDCAS